MAEKFLIGLDGLAAYTAQIEGRYAKKADAVATVTEAGVSGASWFRVWSDGTIEQGGTVSGLTLSGRSLSARVVELPRAFSAGFSVAVSPLGFDTVAARWSPGAALDSFGVTLSNSARTPAEGGFRWVAVGK